MRGESGTTLTPHRSSADPRETTLQPAEQPRARADAPVASRRHVSVNALPYDRHVRLAHLAPHRPVEVRLSDDGSVHTEAAGAEALSLNSSQLLVGHRDGGGHSRQGAKLCGRLADRLVVRERGANRQGEGKSEHQRKRDESSHDPISLCLDPTRVTVCASERSANARGSDNNTRARADARSAHAAMCQLMLCLTTATFFCLQKLNAEVFTFACPMMAAFTQALNTHAPSPSTAASCSSVIGTGAAIPARARNCAGVWQIDWSSANAGPIGRARENP